MLYVPEEIGLDFKNGNKKVATTKRKNDIVFNWNGIFFLCLKKMGDNIGCPIKKNGMQI